MFGTPVSWYLVFSLLCRAFWVLRLFLLLVFFLPRRCQFFFHEFDCHFVSFFLKKQVGYPCNKINNHWRLPLWKPSGKAGSLFCACLLFGKIEIIIVLMIFVILYSILAVTPSYKSADSFLTLKCYGMGYSRLIQPHIWNILNTAPCTIFECVQFFWMIKWWVKNETNIYARNKFSCTVRLDF